MRSLLDFFIKHISAFLFLLLEGLSLYLLFGLNDNQNVAFMTSAGGLSGRVFAIRTSIGDYFSLKKDNLRLAQENARLQEILLSVTRDSSVVGRDVEGDGMTMLARVVDNSVRKADNYLSIDLGVLDGVDKGMGVYNDEGVVGMVMMSGKHYSVVLPVLNSRTSISCRIKNCGNFGFLEWAGKDPYHAQLKDIPYQSKVETGDTVLTSGFSDAFPENTMVGTVSAVSHTTNSNTLDIVVKLSADISTLNWVYIHKTRLNSELDSLWLKVGQ